MSHNTTPTPDENPGAGKPAPTDSKGRSLEHIQDLHHYPHEERNLEGIDQSIQAEASSAHSRINIPLNLGNWKKLPADIQAHLLWFHQWILDHDLGWQEAVDALGMDRSAVFKVLKGTYEAKNWDGVKRRIATFRAVLEKKAKTLQSEFQPNRISQTISAGCDWVSTNNSMGLIIGESRVGKTVSLRDWRDRHNHGRTVLVEVPPVGGPKGLLRQIAKRVGANLNASTPAMLESVVRAFNEHRVLLIDEVHRCITSGKGTPYALEIIRHIHDSTKAAVMMSATARLTEAMQNAEYQYEQIIGRLGIVIRLDTNFTEADILPIIGQHFPEPSSKLFAALLAIANAPGRLGVMGEILKVAHTFAKKDKEVMQEKHVFNAIALRSQMGSSIFA